MNLVGKEGKKLNSFLDTGITIDNGCHGVKAGGFGVSVGKYAGIKHTPLGEAKFNTEIALFSKELKRLGNIGDSKLPVTNNKIN